MNVKVVHIDINVLTTNIPNGNKLSVDCKKKICFALYSVSVCSKICC